jgi:hypothetical protein
MDNQDRLAAALAEGSAAGVAAWYLHRSREELLIYARQMEAGARRPELAVQAPGLLLAAKMLRDAAEETNRG